MKRALTLLSIILLNLVSCNNLEKTSKLKHANNLIDIKNKSICTKACIAKNESSELSCKLTTPELQRRKETLLKKLREQILIKKELENGYAYKFEGTDSILDQLSEFIKTERACCDFFIFGLSISGDKSEIWLELTGPKGSKDFIDTEFGI
nr:hypothetical protein [uncultured Psychroserpens sp.]